MTKSIFWAFEYWSFVALVNVNLSLKRIWCSLVLLSQIVWIISDWEHLNIFWSNLEFDSYSLKTMIGVVRVKEERQRTKDKVRNHLYVSQSSMHKNHHTIPSATLHPFEPFSLFWKTEVCFTATTHHSHPKCSHFCTIWSLQIQGFFIVH